VQVRVPVLAAPDVFAELTDVLENPAAATSYVDPSIHSSRTALNRGSLANPFRSIFEALEPTLPNKNKHHTLILLEGDYEGKNNVDILISQRNMSIMYGSSSGTLRSRPEHFPNRHTLHTTFADRFLIISGYAGPLATRIDCRGTSGWKIGNSEVTFSGITFRNCHTTTVQDSGAALSIVASNITMDNVRLLSNVASSSGGAIYAEGCSLSLSRISFSSNKAPVGNDVYARNSSIEVHRSVTEGSEYTAGASVVYVGGSATVENSPSIRARCAECSDEPPQTSHAKRMPIVPTQECSGAMQDSLGSVPLAVR
jgi:predicted outer membrane repeat protein